MTSTASLSRHKWRFGGAFTAGLLFAAQAAADAPSITVQDLRIAGRVLHFLDSHPSKIVILAVIYSASNARSHDEAMDIAALFGDGLAVGDLLLKPLLVEQAELAGTTGYAAIFATAGVSPTLVDKAMKQRQVPCLTGHLEQVEQGACTVAIRSLPSVSIVVNQANATSAGVKFATAFRMMVREI